MPERAAPKAARNDQFNVRVTAEQAAALATVQYLDDISPPELLRQLLDDEIARRLDDPDFVDALRVRELHRAKKSGKVTNLPRADDAS